MVERNGKRTPRAQRTATRKTQMIHFTVITDTKETEFNYFNGLWRSLPLDISNRLSIHLIKNTQTAKLIDEAIKIRSTNSNYSETWIVLDRDEVKNFDQIVDDAGKYGIQVGWSNPCIEIWFHAYLGKMPFSNNSVECCKEFKRIFEQKVGKRYRKSDTHIYETLSRVGNESDAILFASRRYEQHRNEGKCKPSEMIPCTTLHIIIQSIHRSCQNKKPTIQ